MKATDIQDMSPTELNKVVDAIFPLLVQKFANTSEVIVNNGSHGQKIKMRFLNSNQISADSRVSLDTALQAMLDAPSVEELGKAAHDFGTVIKTIAIGNEG